MSDDAVERPEHFDSVLWTMLTDEQRKQVVSFSQKHEEQQAQRRPELVGLSEDDLALTHAVHSECWRAMKDTLRELGPFAVDITYAEQLEAYLRETLLAALRSAKSDG